MKNKFITSITVAILTICSIFALPSFAAVTDATNDNTVVEEVTDADPMTVLEEGIDLNNTKKKYISGDQLTVHDVPEGEILDRLPLNTEVDVLDTVYGGWTAIYHNDDIRWVATDYLSDGMVDQSKVAQPVGNMRLWRRGCRITFYNNKGRDCHGDPVRPGYGCASNVLPQGTRLYIAGIGYRTVTDCGGKVMNDGRVDVVAPTVTSKETLRYASKMPQYADVYIVE